MICNNRTITFTCPNCQCGLRVDWPYSLRNHPPPRKNPLSRWIRRRAVTWYHYYDQWRLGKNISDATLYHWMTTCLADPLNLDDEDLSEAP